MLFDYAVAGRAPWLAAAPPLLPSSERLTGETAVDGIDCVFLCSEPDEPVVRISFGLIDVVIGDGKVSSYCYTDECRPFLTMRSGLLTRRS